MTRWLKYGLILSGIYVSLTVIFLAAALLGIGGTGEDNIFGWALIFNCLFLVKIFDLIHIKLTFTTIKSMIFIFIIQAGLLFLVGAFIGLLINKIKPTK